MTSQYETIILEKEQAIATITINRPDVLNALNEAVIAELGDALFNEIDQDIRAIVIQGAGEKAFVAGADIVALSKMSAEEALAFSKQGQTVFNALEKLPQITIAKVQGFALGGGCELAMACDIIIASKNARFGQPEANLGLIPGFGGTQRLVKKVGLAVALDMLACGKSRSLKGEEALAAGLISRVAEPEELDSEVSKAVKAILSSGPTAVSEVKRLAREALEMPLEAGMSSEASSFANCFSREESEEGIKAFLEKRSASFSQS